MSASSCSPPLELQPNSAAWLLLGVTDQSRGLLWSHPSGLCRGAGEGIEVVVNIDAVPSTQRAGQSHLAHTGAALLGFGDFGLRAWTGHRPTARVPSYREASAHHLPVKFHLSHEAHGRSPLVAITPIHLAPHVCHADHCRQPARSVLAALRFVRMVATAVKLARNVDALCLIPRIWLAPLSRSDPRPDIASPAGRRR